MNPPYPSDAQAKAEILDAGRKIYQRGLVAANGAICPFGWGTTPCGLRPPVFQKAP